MTQKTFTIVAGPNGAGKTTFIENTFTSLVEDKKFINADYIARDLNPNDVSKVAIQAGKVFLKKLDELIAKEQSFVIETTLSGKLLLKKIKIAKENGFHVHLAFLSLSSAPLCDFRVKARVALGGHNIQLHDIKRRFVRGLLNLQAYKNIVDSFELYNADNKPILILSKKYSKETNIYDDNLLKKFNQLLQQQG